MPMHNIIIICCSMLAILLASTSTYHLHPDSLQSFGTVVAELVSNKANNAQRLISDSLFGHRDSESSVFEDYGRVMKILLQNIIPVSKCAADMLQASLNVGRVCLLVDAVKDFNVPKRDIDRKRLTYLIFDKTKRLLFVDMKNILEIFQYMSLPGGMEKYSKLLIYLPVTSVNDNLKFMKQFCVLISMSSKKNNMNRKSNIYAIFNTYNLNGKTKNSVASIAHYLNSKMKPSSAHLKVHDAATVTDKGIPKAQTDQNSQHEISPSFRYDVNSLASVDRVSHRHQVGSNTGQIPHLGSRTLTLANKVSQLSFNFVSKVIHLLTKKQQTNSSTFKRHSIDDVNLSREHSELPTSIRHETSLWKHVMPPTCDPRVLPCNTEALQHARKRASSFGSELDTEFAHLPRAALEFLSPSSTSCSDVNEPMIHDNDSPIHNSLPVHLSWLPYQIRKPSFGCRTQLWTQINPARLWPRILLLAKCVCDGSRCAPNGPHKCVSIKVPVVSLIRDTREDGDRTTRVRRQKEMLPVGCVCSEQKSVLLREHQPHILV